MVVPCRLITRQRSHMGLTDGRTFIGLGSAVAVGDAAACEVVRRELEAHLVAGSEADVVLPHLPRDLGEHVVTALDLHPEHRARQGFHDFPVDLDLLLFDRRYLLIPREP
jgi:hypothetical protein